MLPAAWGGASSHALPPPSDWSFRNRRRTAARPETQAEAVAVGQGRAGFAQIEPRCHPAGRSDHPAPGRVSTSLFAFSFPRGPSLALLGLSRLSLRARGPPGAPPSRSAGLVSPRNPRRSAIGPLRKPRPLIGPWGCQGDVLPALSCPPWCGARGNRCAGAGWGEQQVRT